MAYDKNTNYQAKIDEAVKNGDYASASKLEQERNEKIDGEGLAVEKTNKYTIPNGVDDATYNKMNSTFSESDSVKDANAAKEQGLSNLGALTNKEQIISQDVMETISNNSFIVPSSVSQADAYLAEQLSKIQSGKTSYSDQVQSMMDKIMNREKFSYDVDADPLFQQALSSAMSSGKQAMQDTIGQASALTGGYGSSYATSAGNQAYNSFIEDAYDNLPQYYQMALEAYQMEGDEMYRQFGMLSELDDKEFNRNVTAYDATFQARNRAYDEAYALYRDNKSDAFALANVQLNEHGQRVNDAYSYYNAASNYADTLYEREYTKWADEVNMAYQYAGMLNSDWWNQTNFDEGVRQYEKNFAEDVRQFDTTFNENVRQYEKSFAEGVRQYDTTFAENQRQFNESMAENKRQFDSTMAYNYTALNSRGSGGGGGSGGGSGGSSIVVQDMSSNSNVKLFNASLMTEREFAKRGKSATTNGQKKRYDTYDEYYEDKLEQAQKSGSLTNNEVAFLLASHYGG